MKRVPIRRSGIVRLFTIIAVVLVAGTSAAIEKSETPPEFSLRASDGRLVSLSDYRGKVVYLDFWASWCGPCEHTLPWMQRLQQRFQSRGFEVVAVNLDATKSEAEKLLSRVAASYTVLFDPTGTVASKYDIPSMPTSLLIGRDGKVAAVHAGFEDGDGELIERQISNLLQTPSDVTLQAEARR